MTTHTPLITRREESVAAAEALRAQREASLRATAAGPPARTSNPFFGVGPITSMAADEVEGRASRFEFEAWLEANYRKAGDQGQDLGPFTAAEIEQSMHRGYPADKIVADMMREIHRYFGFSTENRMAVGLGGGHNGFTVALLHLMNPGDPAQNVFVDTVTVETPSARQSGFFRQSWAAQLLELQERSATGSPERIHFATHEGHIPPARELKALGIKLFVGVGHETTGATTYSEVDARNLLEWLALDRQSHHALIDGTSLLGAMPWPEELIRRMLDECCFFMPFQKAIGGVPGYFVATFTPHAIDLIEVNVRNPAWAIPRHLKLAVPKDAQRPLTSEKTTAVGPFYDPVEDKMLGGIINTFSNVAFAETTFAIHRLKRRVGSAEELNRQSITNRDAVTEWVKAHPLFSLGVDDESRRGAAVTLLKVDDPDLTDLTLRAKVIAKTKQLLGYEGLTHPNGEREPGLDVARYINPFPGTPGDFRAWIGGTRSRGDIVALLDNLEYAYHRAKIVVIEELLAKLRMPVESRTAVGGSGRKDDPSKAYKVLIIDPIGLKADADGRPNIAEVRAHIEGQGGVFHEGPIPPAAVLSSGVHFSYQPDLSREEEILAQTADRQYDALIAAATVVPEAAVVRVCGVRIGAGTGNMRSRSWGGGNGNGGPTVLMNTPSFNSRATAQMAFRALLRAAPGLPVAELHQRVIRGDFDTGRNLREYPTEKLEGKRIAVLGFGNIGREVAKLAKAFGMQIIVYSRPRHKKWCESEGFGFASMVEEAALNADFLSIHTGLGALRDGRYENQGLVNGAVLEKLNRGAVVVNYDRGEVIDAGDLRAALLSGRVHRVCVDADVFVDDSSGRVAGPLVPYVELAREFPEAFELLPHAAADTEHISRVEGAKQAVDQVLRAIRYREVVNLKGDLPEGYVGVGPKTVSGVGKVDAGCLRRIAADRAQAARLRVLSERLAEFWGASTHDPQRLDELVRRYGGRVVLDSNLYATAAEELGLIGPFE